MANHAQRRRTNRRLVIALATIGLAPLLAAMQCVVRDRSQTPSTSGVALQTIAEGFVSPVGIAFPNDGTGRRFVVDQVGVIHVVNSAGTVLSTPLLDLRDRMASLNARDERGLLSM
ncbi:MAG TPA: hypothetical protein P5081_04955, partial [Phycisphaerae bacterium]|nr:hypothetical protein [Phycisphaerae bacterium]